MKFLIIAGNHQIFQRYIRKKNISKHDAIYVMSEYDFRGYPDSDVVVVLTCGYMDKYNLVQYARQHYVNIINQDPCCHRFDYFIR